MKKKFIKSEHMLKMESEMKESLQKEIQQQIDYIQQALSDDQFGGHIGCRIVRNGLRTLFPQMPKFKTDIIPC